MTDFPFPDEERYFVSGSNHAGEIRGLARVGQNVGVAAPEVNEAAVKELLELAGLDTKVFVDSGAFSEVEFGPAGPQITHPMSAADWDKVFALYVRLGAGLRHQLYVVAPDCVAHQKESLERLERYAPRVKALHALGVNVILPVQKGALPMIEFASKAVDLLGFLPIFGIPSKKDATTLQEVLDFVMHFPRTCAVRFHLLGLGVYGDRYEDAVGFINAYLPFAEVFADSVRITALVGRKNGRGGGPRPLTAARDVVIAAGVTGVASIKAEAIKRVWRSETKAQIARAKLAGWYDPELGGPPDPVELAAAQTEDALGK